MKKYILLLSVPALFLVSCNPEAGSEQQSNPEMIAKTDSVKEQKNLDSLFNAASKNVTGGKDSTASK